MRTALDVAGLVAFGGAASGAGWWAHASVDEWRMRRLLVRINERITQDRSGALDG